MKNLFPIPVKLWQCNCNRLTLDIPLSRFLFLDSYMVYIYVYGLYLFICVWLNISGHCCCWLLVVGSCCRVVSSLLLLVFAVFRQLICFVTLSPFVVLIASLQPRGSESRRQSQSWSRRPLHWHMTRGIGALQAIPEPISTVPLFVTLQLLCFLFHLFHSNSRFLFLLPTSIYFMVNFGVLPSWPKNFSNEPHTDFRALLFPAGCATISIHNCMYDYIVSAQQLWLLLCALQ